MSCVYKNNALSCSLSYFLWLQTVCFTSVSREQLMCLLKILFHFFVTPTSFLGNFRISKFGCLSEEKCGADRTDGDIHPSDVSPCTLQRVLSTSLHVISMSHVKNNVFVAGCSHFSKSIYMECSPHFKYWSRSKKIIFQLHMIVKKFS